MNYRFDLDDWLRRFPLEIEAARTQGYLDAEIISGPRSLCINEQLRGQATGDVDWGKPVPVDVFVMGIGEPQDRHVTKIGGLPYWPKGEPWPTAKDGKPMTFVAQLCFADLTDIVDPDGDLLLIFAEGEACGEFHLQWQDIGDVELIEADDVPSTYWRFATCHGHIARVNSYPEFQWRSQHPGKLRVNDIEIPSDYLLPQYQATQIGTAPFLIQEDPKPAGDPLCTVSAVCVQYDSPYPWVNHTAVLKIGEPVVPAGASVFGENFDPQAAKDLMHQIHVQRESLPLQLGDTGCIYVYRKQDGELTADAACY